ncbi:NAD(P)/FAD-dependent oxidoreductase [Kineobactrum salinum]|uniref:NAD(P)/FAD-dependent oxidoreductase n=1 Tax=Kineobactrum salinum TaxID=2708301 RepID=A0A6C0U0X1_9GAMM|nr:NAD(P)/FAD-dependent oxidoreductase [Kineobactrum salinum]QIB64627.1 NAD(P)/FAD-dependent oxidoreductase [Kineobactrum salinum]
MNQSREVNAGSNLQRIVIVGGGAGGLVLATELGDKLKRNPEIRVTLVDRSPTHIWKPLLHEVAAGSINSYQDELNYFAHGASHHFEFQLGAMTGIDRAAKKISLAALLDDQGKILVPERQLSYTALVIAVGSTSNDFGTAGAREHCIFLDSRQQAEMLHKQFLSTYIIAHAEENPPANGNSLNIAIIGAGATGVELAAELKSAAEQLAAYGLKELQARDVHVTLFEAGPRILPMLTDQVAVAARRQLEKMGITVTTGAKIVEVSAQGLQTADGEFIPASLRVWSAGIKAPDFLAGLDGLEVNRINQLAVRPTLQTTTDPAIFAFGDCASCEHDGMRVPPRAQAAHQQATFLAHNLPRFLAGQPLRHFSFKDHGSLVSLSEQHAVGRLMGNLLGGINLHGLIARLMYRFLYRQHQYSLHGLLRTGVFMLKDLLGKGANPRLKLH